MQVLVGGSLLLPVGLYLSNCLLNLFKKEIPISEELLEEKDFAIIVHADKSLQNVEAIIQSLLNLNYTNYLIYVVTNNNIHHFFNKEKIVVLRSENACADESRLYRYVIENFKRPHTHLAILCGIADTEYLNQLNVFFNKGYCKTCSKRKRQHHY